MGAETERPAAGRSHGAVPRSVLYDCVLSRREPPDSESKAALGSPDPSPAVPAHRARPGRGGRGVGFIPRTRRGGRDSIAGARICSPKSPAVPLREFADFQSLGPTIRTRAGRSESGSRRGASTPPASGPGGSARLNRRPGDPGRTPTARAIGPALSGPAAPPFPRTTTRLLAGAGAGAGQQRLSGPARPGPARSAVPRALGANLPFPE